MMPSAEQSEKLGEIKMAKRWSCELDAGKYNDKASKRALNRPAALDAAGHGAAGAAAGVEADAGPHGAEGAVGDKGTVSRGFYKNSGG